MVKIFNITLFLLFLVISSDARTADLKIKSDSSPKTVELPKPTGKYEVGTTAYHWKDKKREELWTTSPSDYRQLMVQIWYPADEKSKGKKAPYIFNFENIRPSIEKYWEDMPTVLHHATLDVPVSNLQGRYPVLVLSHGMNSSRFAYTSISQELASQGYIVASIDHTYWGPGVAFPDGEIVSFDDGMIARDKLDYKEIDSMMLEGITVMSADQAFVADKLQELNTGSKLFKNKIDLSKMGSIGHSMGGMAAMASCLKYVAFKTCVSLDGANYFLNKMPHPSSKPFLFLRNSQWGKKNFAQIKKRYLEAWKNPTVIIINGTKHNYFSDIPLIEPPEKKDGLMKPLKAFRIISKYTVSFLDIHLRGSKKDLPKFDETEFVDLRNIDPTQS